MRPPGASKTRIIESVKALDLAEVKHFAALEG
jgi:hypothetical protein